MKKIHITSRKKNKTEERPVDAVFFDLAGSEMPEPDKKEDTFGLLGPDDDSFEVNVRNAEPIIRPMATEQLSGSGWVGALRRNFASACSIMSLLCLLLVAADETGKIPFVIAGLVVYMIIATLESADDERLGRIRLYMAGIFIVLLIAALVVLRGYIGSGLALIMNQLYDYGESMQAYVYDRFPVGSAGDEDPYQCMWIAVTWISILLGVVTSLPSEGTRRGISLAVASYAMILFAYYGLIPSWVCLAVIVAGILFVLAQGSIISTLAILLAVAVSFGAIMLIDPGENYSISRADEIFRDRFALRSSFLEKDSETAQEMNNMEIIQQNLQNQDDGEGTAFMKEHKLIITAAVLIFILAAVGTAVWVVMRRVRKRQAEHRAGIDSADPKEAIVAMFPYAVRWLQPTGIDILGKPFPSLLPVIRSDLSEEYADRYEGMYEMWKEAAYSDHDMSEDNRSEMKSFLDETISLFKDNSDLQSRVTAAVRYAL